MSNELPLGIYVVTEINAQKGYIASDDFEIVADKQDEEKIIKVENKAILVSLSIVKKDIDTGNPIKIAGTQFQIRDSEDNLVLDSGSDTFITDDTGYVTLTSPLTAGNYMLHEITPPYSYYIDVIF